MQFFKVQGYFFQLIATLIGCLLIFGYGMLLGITPNHTKIYKTEKTPLNKSLNENELYWMNLYLLIGSLIGLIVFGFFAIKIGRKLSLMLSGLFQISGWFYIAFGYDIIHIYISRILIGSSGGGAFILLPIFITEISEIQNNTNLQLLIFLFKNLGILFGFIITNFQLIHYDILPLFGVIFISIFTLSIPFVQESPYYYLIKGDLNLLSKSIRWYRAIRTPEQKLNQQYINEIEKFNRLHEKSKFLQKFQIINMFSYFKNIKIFLIGFTLATGLHFCGILTTFNLSSSVLQKIVKKYFYENDNMEIILICIKIIGNIIALIVVSKINRKIIMAISSFGTCLCLSLLGGILLLEDYNIYIEKDLIKWLSMTSFYGSIAMINIGLLPFSLNVITEIFPYHRRVFIMTILMIYEWLITFGFEMFIDVIINTLKISGYLWLFAGFLLFETIFIVFIFPKTKQLSLEIDQKDIIE